MSERSDRINQLSLKLEALLKRQEFFIQEINMIKSELDQLQVTEQEMPAVAEDVAKTESTPLEVVPKQPVQEPVTSSTKETVPKAPVTPPDSTIRQETQAPKAPLQQKTNLEKFIGENLINKIGIVVTVLGVSLGAKYAIDNDLISPLTRIILGYVVGALLLFFGVRLKKNYLNYSAVLLSGAMAIFYFITYAALTFYQLYSEVTAFVIMVAVTVFTVYSAIRYDKQVIAHLGLVGAYAIPFLVSEDPGQIEILFSYTAIINVGILVVAFRKYWKPLYYVSFMLTWFIYFLWYVNEAIGNDYSTTGMLFLVLFFLIFYTMFIAYKLFQKEKFAVDDVFLILANTFIFFGTGYNLIDSMEAGSNFLGLFTLCNALIHAAVGVLIYYRKVVDRNLFHLIIGLAILFTTLTIPVELSGKWITLLWAGEAAILFWIGRHGKTSFYEYLAYPVMAIAFFSLVDDWTHYISVGDTFVRLSPILNWEFLTSLIATGFFGSILYLDMKSDYPALLKKSGLIYNLIVLFIPALFIGTLYNTFRLEIVNYWMSLYIESGIDGGGMQNDLLKFRDLSILNYSAVFLGLLAFVNDKWVKALQLRWISFGIILLLLMLFLPFGLYELSELRVSYLYSIELGLDPGIGPILIRYISLLIFGMLLYATREFVLRDELVREMKMSYELILVVTICWVLSSELLHWLDFADSTSAYKLGLSIFWGVYSLILIVLGIWKKKKHLRIAAITLFGATLIKLFFYDISHLDTISKVIVFVSLGMLLLIISFLYNKYKDKIFS
jgi:uncharacterized membrane protein